MHPELSKIYTSLSEKRKHLIEKMEMISPEILQYKPDEYTWSAIQVLNHLVLAEQLSLGYIKKKLPAIDHLEQVGLKQKMAMRLMKLAQKSSKKFKAPKPVSQPKNDSDLASISREWERVQDELKVFLGDYPERHLYTALYKHPFMGRISLGQMMQVNIYHIARHERQIDRRIENFSN